MNDREKARTAVLNFINGKGDPNFAVLICCRCGLIVTPKKERVHEYRYCIGCGKKYDTVCG